MAKDKKAKNDGKKARAAEKKAKQEKKSEKKGEQRTKKQKANDSDAEDVDIDSVLAEYSRRQELFLKVTETVCDPPRARASSTLIASPENENELFLFGGEYFNGAVAEFFNDMYVYLVHKDEWRSITSPNTPLPRSGHAWCRGGNSGGIYLFGGEFSSPKQGTFYHYNDFWHFDPSSREWTRLETKSKAPPARSGHRMTYFKNYIILFGGFQDTSQQTKYMADLWVYDTQNYVWHNPPIPPATQKPDARSSFSFLPHDSGAVIYGGYSRIKAMVMGRQTKGGGQAQRNVLKPMLHQDCFFLRILQPPAGAAINTPPSVRWERRRKPQNIPTPARAGATMTYHKGRGISFGGVHDVEESEEGIESEFFNQLFVWNIERNRNFPLLLRKPRVHQQRSQEGTKGGRRGKGQASEEELLRNLAALRTGRSLADIDGMNIENQSTGSAHKELPSKVVCAELPLPRFNAQLAVQGDVLYIFGGTYERGDREFTFDEMYAVDLGKMDGVREIFRREPDNWLGEEDSEDDDDEDGEGSDEDSEDDEGDVKMMDEKPHHIESTRKSRNEEKRLAYIDGASEAASSLPLTAFDDAPEDSATANDGLPYPRPFESRRDFFQRTGSEWQEALMTKLRWKGIQPEGLGVKEIKTRAYEMSEEKWWDCREEITALEDEQDAAGIGEVVTLAERGNSEGSGIGRRR